MIYDGGVGLRLVEEEDLPLLVQWRNDLYTRTMFYTPFLISFSGQKKWYNQLLNDETRVLFMIVKLNDNRPVGTIGLHQIDYRNQEAHFGPLILDPMERGYSFAAAATRILVRYAFQELNLHRLYAEALAYNKPVRRLATVLGFRTEGIARKAAFSNGEFHDVILTAMLREEWQDGG